MDWGIAKQIRGGTALPASKAGVNPDLLDPRERLFSTRNDQCIGTPAYMSPEQAQGKNDQIDERSDIYSATVLLHELLSLRHYLSEYETFSGLVVAISTMPITYSRLLFMHHPDHPTPRAEVLHFIVRGLAKDPAQRPDSADRVAAEAERPAHRARGPIDRQTARADLTEISLEASTRQQLMSACRVGAIGPLPERCELRLQLLDAACCSFAIIANRAQRRPGEHRLPLDLRVTAELRIVAGIDRQAEIDQMKGMLGHG